MPSGHSKLPREERRNQILDAALALFAEKGLHDTKVSEVAAKAGVSQGTIYWHFESKEALFEASFRKEFDSLLEPLVKVSNDPSYTASQKLIMFARGSFELALEHTDTMLIMFQAMTLPELAGIIAHDFVDYYEQFTQILTPLFEELGDPDPSITAWLYISLLDGLALQLMLNPDIFDQERVIEQLKHKFNFMEG